MIDSVTHRCGKFLVTLKQLPGVTDRWRCQVGDDWGQIDFRDSHYAEMAIRNAAYQVNAKPEDWLLAFGLK